MSNHHVSESRISALKEKHAKLEREIHQEELRPHPDDMLLKKLKQQKLVVKQELESNTGVA